MFSKEEFITVKKRSDLYSNKKFEIDQVTYCVEDNTFYHLKDISRRNKKDGWEQVSAVPQSIFSSSSSTGGSTSFLTEDAANSLYVKYNTPAVPIDQTIYGSIHVVGNISATGEVSAFAGAAPINWWDSMPYASATTVGGIKVGANLTIDANGVLNAAGGAGSATWGSIGGLLTDQLDLVTALNLKANLNSPTFTGTVGGITAAMVGLGNVTNNAQWYSGNHPTTLAGYGITDALSGLTDDVLKFSTDKYIPYVAPGAGHFYNTNTTYPTNTTRLNYDGYFCSTRLYGDLYRENGHNKHLTVQAGNALEDGNEGGNLILRAGHAFQNSIDSSQAGSIFLVPGNFNSAGPTAYVYLGDSACTVTSHNIKPAGTEANISMHVYSKGTGTASLTNGTAGASISVMSNYIWIQATSGNITFPGAYTYTLNTSGAYESTGRSLTIRTGDNSGTTGDYPGGNILIYGGAGLNNGSRGTVCLGNGTNICTLSVNNTETYLVGINSTSGLLSRKEVASIYVTPTFTGPVLINGDLNVTGEVTAYYTSDRRLKEDIKPFKALSIIDMINPVSFKWNGVAKKLNPSKDDRINYGVIAQDLGCTLPELIHETEDNYYTVDYVQLIPIILQAMKEFRKLMIKLDADVNYYNNCKG